MADYRLFGAETSPYSLKVRSALRYKGVAFDWIARSVGNEAEFRKSAATPTVPLLLSPTHAPAQDSTLILSTLEAAHPEPPARPEEPAAQALAIILEDYADEWLNKCMFQQRWGQQPDRDAAALRVLVQLNDGKKPRAFKAPVKQIATRMLARLPLVGAEPENAPTLESSYRRFALRLNTHLQNHLFIFGGRPSAADFAIAAQYQQMLTDPTPGAWLTERAPFLTAWCGHMEDPKASGPCQCGERLAREEAVFGDVRRRPVRADDAGLCRARLRRRTHAGCRADERSGAGGVLRRGRDYRVFREARLNEKPPQEGLRGFISERKVFA